MTRHQDSHMQPSQRMDRLGIALMVVGLLVFVAFAVVRIVVDDAKWAVPVLFSGWVIWFIGKSIRKNLSTRQQKEDHLRRTEDAKRNEAADAAARDREHSA